MNREVPSGQPAGAAPPLLKERYELGERLAEGTFFFTHRGRDVETGKTVAIKVLRPEFAGDETFSARLVSEAQSAVRLDHPNIAQIYDAWRERGTVVLAVEWVRGINLKERIQRVAPFPLAVAVDIALACAEALEHAHDNGFIHGDVRPDNVIITPDGRVKLTDFGVGASVAASSRIQMNALPQAAYYLAPELAEGHAPDARTDLYSLGCVFYEMLAAEVPYKAETPLAIALKHLNEPVPSLKKVNPSIPLAVEGIAEKCMQKAPRARYVKVQDLLKDLRSVREAIRTDKPLNWSPMAAAAEGAPVPQRTRTRSQRPKREEPEEPAASDGGPGFPLLAGLALLAVLMIVGFFGLGVALTRSPGQVTVPANLVRMNRDQAVALLERLKLRPDVREDYNERVPAGTVYRVIPDAGAELRAGRPVILYVSKGPEPVAVPDLIGKDVDAAQRAIKEADLVVGETREEFSEVIPKGEIMAQSPVGGNSVRKNSAVNITVSKGPEPIPEPQPVDVEPEPDTTPAEPAEPGQPDGEPDPGDTPSPDLPAREHEVTVQVPRRRTGPQIVKIIVRNEDGTENTVYEQEHQPGDTVSQTVTTLGARGKCQIRVYINDRLETRTDV